jgi:hypothetical protein
MTLVPIQTVTGNTKQMSRWIKSFIKSNIRCDITKDNYGNIYVTKGKDTLYPTMVCHIDTVHDIRPNIKSYLTTNKNTIFAIDMDKGQQYGTGGDDKVGIAITLMMLNQFEHFKAVFFLDEESGCTGSSQCNSQFFDDSTIVLQCDRRGSLDFVNKIGNKKLYGKSFKKIIKPLLKQHKRTEVTGGITDVGEIAGQNKVMVANMSCGYHDPHMDNETINISEVIETFKLCESIFKLTIFKRFEYNKIKDREEYQMTQYYGGRNIHNHRPDYYNYYPGSHDYNRHLFEDDETNNLEEKTEEDKDIKNNLYGTEEYGTEEYESEIGMYECPKCLQSETEYDYAEDLIWCHKCQDYIDNAFYNIEDINSNKNENKSNNYDDNQKTLNFTD